MKERNIAMAWEVAFDLTQGSRPFERLLNFSDPTHFGQQQSSATDLSLAVYEIVEPRDGSKGSKLKIKHINELLDELVALKGGPLHGNHNFRDDAGGDKKKSPPLKQTHRDWVKQLRDKELSALEYKWIVRILLQKMEIGFSPKAISVDARRNRHNERLVHILVVDQIRTQHEVKLLFRHSTTLQAGEQRRGALVIVAPC
jgi:hypothetical protein